MTLRMRAKAKRDYREALAQQCRQCLERIMSMAWEWSHTYEAYANVEGNIHHMSLADLRTVYAEWRAYDLEQKNHEDPWGKPYDRFIRDANKMSRNELTEYVWERASEFRTCDNGGFRAWVCPWGCHTVSFDLEQGAETRYEREYGTC